MVKFCERCGAKTDNRVPEDDHNPRDICSSSDCGHIHYVNPKIITGAIPIKGNRVLLCRRNIEPRKGYWTLPAGYMEMNESTQEGAARETFEECEASLENMSLYSILDLPHISQVYMFYRADIVGDHFATTPESTEVKLFEEKDIPWEELAFPVINNALRRYFTERVSGNFSIKHQVIVTKKVIG